MRFLRAIAVVCLSVSAWATMTVTGNVKSLTAGNVSSGATIKFTIQRTAGNPVTTTSAIVDTIPVQCKTDTSGNIVSMTGGVCTVLGNDELTAYALGDTYYVVELFDHGTKVWGGNYKITVDNCGTTVCNFPIAPMTTVPPTGTPAWFAKKTGDTFSGPLYLSRDPQTDMEAATKRYVDIYGGNGNGQGGNGVWGQITGTLANQSDLNTALGLKADKSSIINPVNADWNCGSSSGLCYIRNVPLTFTPSSHTHLQTDVTGLATSLGNKADKASITGATKTKITYNSQGIVTAGADLSESDVPSLSIGKTSGLQTALDDKVDVSRVGASEIGGVSGLATLDTYGNVTQSPAIAQVGAGVNKIPMTGPAYSTLDPSWFPPAAVAGVAPDDYSVLGAVKMKADCASGKHVVGINTTDDKGELKCSDDTGGAGSGYGQIQDKSDNNLTTRTTVKFAGSDTTVADDSSNTRTVVTIEAPIDRDIKYCSNYATVQLCHDALGSGGTMVLPLGATSGPLAISKDHVEVRGEGGMDGSTITCTTNNAACVTVSGDMANLHDFAIKHITNKPISGGDGLVFSAGGNHYVRHVHIKNSYYGMVLNSTSWGYVEDSLVSLNESDNFRFVFSGTTPMQWKLSKNLGQQSLGYGYHVINATGNQGTCPRFEGDHSYGNQLGGWFIEATGAGSGIANCAFNDVTGSHDNSDEIKIDSGSGGRGHRIKAHLLEYAGLAGGITMGYDGTAATSTNIGYGVYITNNNDSSNQSSGSVSGRFYNNSFSGVRIDSKNYVVSGEATADGQAGTANSYERAGVAVRADDVLVNNMSFGKDSGNKMLYGIDFSNSVARCMIGANSFENTLTQINGTCATTTIPGLAADKIDGAHASATAAANSIPISDGSNKIAAGYLPLPVAPVVSPPTAGAPGGVQGIVCASGHIYKIGNDGVPVCSADAGGSTVNIDGTTVTTPNFSSSAVTADSNYLRASLKRGNGTGNGTTSDVIVEVPTGTTTGKLLLGDFIGAASGLAPLGSDSKVSTTYLPTSTTSSASKIPLAGSDGKIDVGFLPAVGENDTYSGATKTITHQLVVGEGVTVNQPFLVTGTGATISPVTSKSGIGFDASGKISGFENGGTVKELAKIDSPLSGFTGSIPISTVTSLQTSLDGKANASHTHYAGDTMTGTLVGGRCVHTVYVATPSPHYEQQETSADCGSGTGGGSNVSVTNSTPTNSGTITSPVFNQTTPASPATYYPNIRWQYDSSGNVSAYLPPAQSGTGGALTSNAQTISGAKTLANKLTFPAASTANGASLNIPTMTSAPTPIAGDLWSDGVHLQLRNSTGTANTLAFTSDDIQGTAAKATQLAGTLSPCNHGSAAAGIDTYGNAVDCQALGGATSATAPVHATIPNDASGTTLNYLVSVAGGNAKLPALTDVHGVVGICAAQCQASGSADVITYGPASCVLGNTGAVDDVVTMPSTGQTAGRCYSSGAIRPVKQIVGKISDCGAGCTAGNTVSVWLFGGDTPGVAGTADGGAKAGIVALTGDLGGTFSSPTVVSVQNNAVTAAGLDFSSDVTTANATTGSHGLMPKLPTADGSQTSKYLNGAGAWATVSGTGTVTATAGGDSLTANALLLGAGGDDITKMGSLGTTTTVLHGNAAGAPTFGAVVDGDLSLTSPALGTATATSINGTAIPSSGVLARTDVGNTFTGHQVIEGVTSTGATGTGKFVFDASPTITGHPTVEGVTSTGATGTGKFVFDTAPTLGAITVTSVNGSTIPSSKTIATGPGASTANNLPKFSTTDGQTLTDSGILSSNVVTATTNTNHAVVVGGASGKAVGMVGPGTNATVLFGNTGADPGFRAIANTDLPSTLSSGTAITNAALTTPSLGVATATSINKMAITAPATSSTLAVADGKTLTASNTLTLTGTDSSSVAFGAGGTVQYTTSTVNTVVDTSTPVTVSTTLGAEFHFNQHATAGTAMTYNLPAATAGKQFCFANSNNGSAANTGALTIKAGTGDYIIKTDGTKTASAGSMVSAGAAGDAACVVGVAANNWMLYVQRGTWN